ncbi:uncharacterized protein N7482_010592 [Penicillium canariense]|uniref:Prion-inhibition and propagation HeLo domain-containing protein n=1 Tax=Penicillium canariense TaxID=189055 RepID=A0A9W9LEN6_9EURO|nr:uncharacterized protein N7482_010592 [Penicillium canariense]KAJ5151340.1 hypothetical protein N7482_010592 [Penicillium canariense]
MEIASTAIGVVGLAALFSTCIETLDTLSSAARYSVNREILQTKIEVERLRLMVWGESAGITDIDPNRPEHETPDDLAILDESLQGAALRPAVAGLLTCFTHYFEDIEQLQSRYGVAPRKESQEKQKTTALAEKPTREMLLSTFQKTYLRFQERTLTTQKKTSPLKKAMWAVSDERKFRVLIAELRAINDSLTSLLPAIRDKTRVQMRAEILRSSDVNQLQNLVTAADDVTDLIAETASLRLEMLSTASQHGAPTPAPRAVQVIPTSATSPHGLLTHPSAQDPLPRPKSIVQNLIAATLAAPSGLPSMPGGTTCDLYDNTGALVIHKAYHKPNSLACFTWLVGLGETPESSEVQLVSDSVFDLRYIPDNISRVADKLLEVSVDADRKYAGWSPGSTSLTGFAREATFWNRASELENRVDPSWKRTKSKQLYTSFIHQRWKKIVAEGLGDDFTDRKGYDQLEELLGPSEYTWLDSEEGYKLRHQITDLLGALSSSIVPSFEATGSIALLAFYEKIDPNARFGFADFMRQMLVAREAILRIQRDDRRWYGGITTRVIYDMIAADLWAQNMEVNIDAGFKVSKNVLQQQMDGIIKFVDEMQWPYADEVRKTANHLREAQAHEINVDVRVHDWMGGLVFPGASFPLTVVGVVYLLSPTLRAHMPSESVNIRQGNFGIVYPEASYWHSRSVLGKVLAPLSLSSETGRPQVRCLGGWIGPCPSPSIPECRLGITVSLSTRQPPFAPLELYSSGGDADTISTSGGQGDSGEWMLPKPPVRSSDTVAVQTIRLSKVAVASTSAKDAPLYTALIDFRLERSRTFVTFTLYTNSVFVAAPACRGTHKIDPRAAGHYTFGVRGVEELGRMSQKGDAAANMAILVVNATGGPVSEVFARAWCSHTGTNAVVWRHEGGKCCFKCALMVASTDGLGTGVLIVC